MNDKVIDLTATSTPRIVPPATVTYNSYSLSMSFFEDRDEDDVSGTNESLNRSLPTNQFPRSMRLVLLYLRGEQDKFRGIAEARGEHWKNSWSASIRSIVNYHHVYGKAPNWWGRLDSYLFGVGKAIDGGIKEFLVSISESGEGHVLGGGMNVNASIVDMLKRERHYRAARAIRVWTDECCMTYKITSKRIFKTAARGGN